jgi:hypothetical protein
MACNAARLCERTAGRRVPALPGGGLLRITSHCMRVTVRRARSCRPVGGTLNLRLVPRLARSLARYGKRRTSLRQGWERRGASPAGARRSRAFRCAGGRSVKILRPDTVLFSGHGGCFGCYWFGCDNASLASSLYFKARASSFDTIGSKPSRKISAKYS